MTAKSLVLHIGDPKTGSSSIQDVLRHRKWDAGPVLIDYPAQLSAFPLANALSDPKQSDQRKVRFGQLAEWLTASEADVAVVSAEQFFRVNPQTLLDTMTAFLPAQVADVRIIAYVRPHAGRLVSAFMQRTKAGLFQGDMTAFFQRTQGETLLRYAPRFAKWRRVFGDRFTLRPMIRSELRDGDVVADFLDLVMQGRPFSLGEPVKVNASMPLEQLVGLRDVQTILKRNEIKPIVLHSVGDHVSRVLAQNKTAAGTRLKLSAALYQDVRAVCRADAEALDAAFFGRPVMVQALEDAGQDLAETAQDMAIGAHYSAETIATLREKSRKLVTMFKARPLAWALAFERQIGQRPPLEDGKTELPPIRANIDRVNATLAEIANLLSNPQSKAAD